MLRSIVPFETPNITTNPSLPILARILLGITK